MMKSGKSNRRIPLTRFAAGGAQIVMRIRIRRHSKLPVLAQPTDYK